MVSEGGAGVACGAASKSIEATERASCAGEESRVSGSKVGSTDSGRVRAGVADEDCATRSAAGTRVDEAKSCTFSCVPNEVNVVSGLLGAAGITGAGGWNAAGAIGATGGNTGVITAGGAGAGGNTVAVAAGGGGATKGVGAACTGAGGAAASGITTGGATGIAGASALGCAGPSDGK